MRAEKIEFQNSEGITLSAKIEFPVSELPQQFAIFAHCFTCNKNLAAVRNISRALTQEGIAVMRFDFTGLGDSGGSFEDTNFSSNMQDIVASADYLQQHFKAPSLLIGHSLGGAAVLRAAYDIPSVRAVATLGAPYDPEHVSHMMESSLQEIEQEGQARVSIGGRPFYIKKQFLDDIRSSKFEERIKDLEAALLILHSPQDEIVGIANAARIYHAATHPKSFITLDGADHLMSRKQDSQYAGLMIANWAKRYLDFPLPDPLKSDQEVAVRLGAEGFTTDIVVRHHALTADEPESVGGNDFGPNPYEFVAVGLGACTAMTLHMYARRKKWPLQKVLVHLSHAKDYAQDCENCEAQNSKIDHFDRLLEIDGDLTQAQRDRLLEIADKCPVHRTLEGSVKVRTKYKD